MAMNRRLVSLAAVLLLSGCSAGTLKGTQNNGEPVAVPASDLTQTQSATGSTSEVGTDPSRTADPQAGSANEPGKGAQPKDEKADKIVKLLNPASFCKYKFEGLDSYDYKKYPSWEDLGLDAKLAKELDEKPFPDEVTPWLDKSGCQDHLKRLDQKGRLGVSKADGTVVIKPLYDYLDYPQSSPSKWILCCIKGTFEDKKSDKGFRFIGKDGKEMSKARYHNALPFNEGRAAVELEEQGWGFIDESGKLIIPCRFGSVRSFSEGYATVSSETSGKVWGYIDKDGNEIVPPIFDANSMFKNGYAKVRYQHLWGILKKEQLEALKTK